MKLGGWTVNVTVDAMPQKVATAFSEKFGEIVGAEYNPIAYLGEQVVNGVNHAILAEQTLVIGRDIHNIVMIIMNEREDKFSVVSIDPVLEGGEGLGGTKIDVSTEIPNEQMKAFNDVLGAFVGSKVEPFAYLGSQVTKGTDYIFAAKTQMITRPVGDGVGVKFGNDVEVAIVKVNALTKHAEFNAILSGISASVMGYSFTW